VSQAPETVTQHRLIQHLAALLRAIGDASNDPTRLDELLDALVGIGGVFASAVLLAGGYAGGPFVITATRRESGEQARSWMRWPLRRLFVRMKPAVIFDPIGAGRQALAIPLSHGAARWVVVARLTEAACGCAYDDFLAVIENVTISPSSGECALDSRIPAGQFEPAVVSFALDDDLRDRLDEALSKREWPLAHFQRFGPLTRRLQQSVPDVIVVGTPLLSNPVSAITSIHRIANYSGLRMLAFCPDDFRPRQSSALIDRYLRNDASEAAIFKAVKELAYESTALRRSWSREEHVLAARRAADLFTAQALVIFAAERAAEIMRGWACCCLFNGGAVYRAEEPRRRQPVLNSIPKGFLNGSKIFAPVFDDDFIAEVTDDPRDRDALLAMRPASAATLALVSNDGQHHGVLVAFSAERQVAESAFEALDGLAQLVVRRFDELRCVAPIPELQKESFWERVRDGAFALDVYRSADCAIPWRYRILAQTRGLWTLNIDERSAAARELERLGSGSPAERLRGYVADSPFFAATIDFASQTMEYATEGFSVPSILNRPGPTATVSESAGRAIGTVVLKSPAKALVCDAELWSWLRGRVGRGASLRAVLERERPTGLASVITLG
jgi:hypothetical protein